MRIDQAGRTVAGGGTRKSARNGSGQGFTIDVGGPQSDAITTAGPSMVGGVDALVALQAVEPAKDNRERAIDRGTAMLDALDALKRDLVLGHGDQSSLLRLQREIANGRDTLPDSDGLNDVLDAIDLRAQVEIAKRA